MKRRRPRHRKRRARCPCAARTSSSAICRETIVVTGTLRPKAEIKVIAEVAARLDRLAKDEGSVVRKGELLAVLDDTDYNLTLQRAKASLAVADANRAHAAAERDRANSLLKTGGITDKDHLSAQVNLQVSEASLAQAKVEVAIAEQNVTRTRIVAPFSRPPHRIGCPMPEATSRRARRSSRWSTIRCSSSAPRCRRAITAR